MGSVSEVHNFPIKVPKMFHISCRNLDLRKETMCFFFCFNQVEENVTAFTELEGLGMDQETLSEIEAILEPIKNLTWPSGIDHM